MDRDEKPLRRNAFSAVDGSSKQEDWPVMLPSQPKIMPRLGGSVIQGFSNSDLSGAPDVPGADQNFNETVPLADDAEGKERATEPFPLVQTDARPPLSPGGLFNAEPSDSLDRHHRGSSIPVRSGVPRPSYGRIHDSPVRQKNYPHASEADAFDRKKYSPEPPAIASGFTAGIQLRSATTPVMATHELSAVRSNNQMTLKEILSLPYQTVVERSFFESDSSDESEPVVRGYDADGGFDIKRAYRTSTGGPTLRIRDSASDILLDKTDTEFNDGMAGGKLRRKQTRTNLRQGDGSRNSLQPTSAFIHRSLSSLTKPTPKSFSATGDLKKDIETQRLLEDNAQQLLTNFSLNRQKLVDTDNGQPSSQSFPSSTSSDPAFFNEASLNPFRESVLEEFRHVIATSNSYHRSSVSRIDWQNQDFTDIKMPTAIKPTPLQESSPSASDPEPITLPRTRPVNIPRPASAITHEEPDAKTAPFLFDNEENLSNQPSTSNNLPRLRVIGPDASASSDTSFPIRTTSRKQKPPPLFVSDKTNSRFGSRYTTEVSKTQDEGVNDLRSLEDMKTTPSLNPITNIKAAEGLRYTHSKKVFGRVRGLLKKKSTETLGKTPTKGLTKIPGLLGIHPPPSVRRKAIPDAARFPNSLLDPSSAFNDESDNSRTKLVSSQNPSADPITPFTAGINASPASLGHLSSPPAATSLIATRPTSSTIGIKSPPPMSPPQAGQPQPDQNIGSSPPVTQDDTGLAPELQSAIRLTRTLMRAAIAETEPERRQRLGQLAECMMRMVHTATVAKHAAESAEIEKIKADMAANKCLSALAKSEPVVREVLAMMQK